MGRTVAQPVLVLECHCRFRPVDLEEGALGKEERLLRSVVAATGSRLMVSTVSGTTIR